MYEALEWGSTIESRKTALLRPRVKSAAGLAFVLHSSKAITTENRIALLFH